MENTIFKRTSVRNYTEKNVSQKQIESLLKAAMAAPSGCNAQPWEFIVVTSEDVKNKITEIHPFSQMLKKAPLAIVVCADVKKVPQFVPDVELWPQDCAAATENILLHAVDLGLGGVWLGVHPRKELQNPLAKLFNLPENVIPFSIVSIGEPLQNNEAKDKFDKSKIHYDKW